MKKKVDTKKIVEKEGRRKENRGRTFHLCFISIRSLCFFNHSFLSAKGKRKRKKKCCLHEHGFGETARVIVEDDKVTIFVDQAELHVKRLHEVAAARALILVCYWSWKHLDHHSKLVLLGKALVLEASLPLNEISGLEAFLSE